MTDAPDLTRFRKALRGIRLAGIALLVVGLALGLPGVLPSWVTFVAVFLGLFFVLYSALTLGSLNRDARRARKRLRERRPERPQAPSDPGAR